MLLPRAVPGPFPLDAHCIAQYNTRPYNGRVKPHHFHILVALLGGDRHGLAIVRDVLEQTGGAMRLWPATLYGALEQLADEGLIEPLSERGAHPEGESERRRFYRISRRGRQAVTEETRRLETLAATARARLSHAGGKAR